MTRFWSFKWVFYFGFPRVKQGTHIRKKDAEEVVELLFFQDQELTLDDLVEIRKQAAFEEADKPEPRQN
jgi:hypothetical protein